MAVCDSSDHQPPSELDPQAAAAEPTLSAAALSAEDPAGGARPRGLELKRLGGATALMMGAVLASRVIGYVREAYVAYAFGAGHATDAFVAAFTIPDWLNYLVAGGSLSITFITIFSPFVARKDEQRGYQVFSEVATFLGLLLSIGVLAAEIWTPQLLHLYLPGFSPAQLAECAHMTRILLPAQLFFCLGGLLSATLYTRGAFIIPALAPLVYNSGIILGGVLLGHWMGIRSLAWGALAGALVGPFLMPLGGSLRHGLQYRFRLRFNDPDFRRWVMMTLPLMIGVSLVTADDWIMRPLADHITGAISHLNYAKRLIGVPIAVLGQAVGQASMPFFSLLATQHKWDEFRATVDRSVVRTLTAALLATSWFAALALPIVAIVYQRGHFHANDARVTAAYFTIFVLSLAFWSCQSLYARAFYAAGDTLTPMVQSTVVTLVMIPVYILAAHRLGIIGLALASDTGILVHTVTIAYLLHRRDLLGFSGRRWREVPGVLALALVAGGVSGWLVRRVAVHGLLRDLALVVGGSLVWLLIAVVLTRLLGLEEVRATTNQLLIKARLRRRAA